MNSVKFQNMTPHSINIYTPEGVEIVKIEPSGEVARCAEQRAERPALNGIDVAVATYGDVTGLPDAQPGFAYIVSGMVLSACPDRPDVFAPGPALRDADGKIIGCVGLSCTPAYQGPSPEPDDHSGSGQITLNIGGKAVNVVSAERSASGMVSVIDADGARHSVMSLKAVARLEEAGLLAPKATAADAPLRVVSVPIPEPEPKPEPEVRGVNEVDPGDGGFDIVARGSEYVRFRDLPDMPSKLYFRDRDAVLEVEKFEFYSSSFGAGVRVHFSNWSVYFTFPEGSFIYEAFRPFREELIAIEKGQYRNRVGWGRPGTLDMGISNKDWDD